VSLASIMVQLYIEDSFYPFTFVAVYGILIMNMMTFRTYFTPTPVHYYIYNRMNSNIRVIINT